VKISLFKNIIKHRACDIAFLLAMNIFALRGWFRPGIIEFGDLWSMPRDFLAQAFTLPYTWNSNFFFGPEFMIFDWPWHWVMGMVASLGFDFGVSERLVFFFPYVLLSVAGMYYFTYVLFKDRVICFFSTLLFVFNTPQLNLLYGGIMSRGLMHAAMPLVLGFFVKTLNDKSLKDYLLCGLLLALTVMFEAVVTYLICWVMLLFFLQDAVRMFLARKINFTKNTFISTALIGVILAVPFIILFFWIYPAFFGKAVLVPQYKSLTGMVKTLSYYKFSHAFGLYAPWWPPGLSKGLHQPGIAYYLVPLLAFSAIFLRPRDGKVRLLTFLAFFSVILTMGANPPFSNSYIWLFRHFPGFKAFRDSGRFYILIALAYAPLFGVAISELAGKLNRRDFRVSGLVLKKGWLKTAFLVANLVLIIALVWPVFAGKLGGIYAASKPMPREYQIIENFIKGHSEAFRTFWRPFVGRFAFYDLKFQVFCSGHTRTPTHFFFAENWASTVFPRTKYIAKILGLMNVKYCFLPLEDDTIVSWGKDREYFLSTFRNKAGLKEISLGGNITGFENEFFAPRFFTASRAALAVGSKAALLDLADIRGVDLSGLAVFLSDETTQQNAQLLERADCVVFNDAGLDDLVLNSTPDQYRFDLTGHATPADKGKGGVWSQLITPPADYFGYLYGVMPQNRNGAIFASEKGDVALLRPLEIAVEKEGIYEIWIRALNGPVMGSLSISISRDPAGQLDKADILKDQDLKSGNYCFRWIKAGAVYLGAGKHYFDAINRNGQGLVDQLIVIPQKAALDYRQRTEGSLAPKDIIIFRDCNRLPVEVAVPIKGRYQMFVRLAAENFRGQLDFFLNEKKITSINLNRNEELFFAGGLTVNLAAGENRISFARQGSGKLILQRIVLLRMKKPVKDLDELFPKEQRVPAQWKMLDPTKYEVKLETGRPAFLIFSDAFDPRWQLYLKSPVDSVCAYGMLNSFFIGQPGKIDAILEFTPQKYVYQGLVVSGLGLILILSLIIYLSLRPGKKKYPQ
jgi:hypothetical protein